MDRRFAIPFSFNQKLQSPYVPFSLRENLLKICWKIVGKTTFLQGFFARSARMAKWKLANNKDLSRVKCNFYFSSKTLYPGEDVYMCFERFSRVFDRFSRAGHNSSLQIRLFFLVRCWHQILFKFAKSHSAHARRILIDARRWQSSAHLSTHNHLKKILRKPQSLAACD